MAIEPTYDFIDSLNDALPDGLDLKLEGDNHIRGIKTVLKGSFPNITGAVNGTQAELNVLAGVTPGASDPSKALVLDGAENLDLTDVWLKNVQRIDIKNIANDTFLYLISDTAPVDETKWRINNNAGVFALKLVDDAETVGVNALTISRTGTTADTLNVLTTNLLHNGITVATKEYRETVEVLSGTAPALSPNSGTIKTWTLTGNSTPTLGTWDDGQSMTLMIDDGTAYTITWTTVNPTWVNNGGAAPTLATTGYTVVVLWQVAGTVYGALVGDGT